ncbi:glycosyltransferase family 4 protein [Desulfomonile tiedjei]|uniref:Glycosyltransferase n=1 Tax=Desulfomonile tiedjei (strain ATCC 49306 / DSM 6799 / DCB-1) TaxID=706587 RepID=I4CEB4_DESTA|nr:glycosyltransferase family 4 protein [Desulfomonile tiedjei]AFM27905.1 glycosyltransferase [Desulfomonile tiedjei DSM 6799]
MHILIITDRFYPEITAPSFRILEHSRKWIELGNEVTVVTCAPNFPRGELFPGYRNALYQEEIIEGIRVIRLFSYMAPNEKLVRRVLDYASFMVSAILQSFRFPGFDLILATSPPLFVPMAGCVISRLLDRPWIFELRDLWPDSIKAVGALNGGIVSFTEKIELFLYRNSDHVISLTHSFKENLVSRGIPAEKITVVENAVDTDFFHPTNVKLDARAALGVNGKDFLAGYIGTVGMAHGIETIVHAASLCKDHEHLKFLIMGEGAERARIQELTNANGLKNVIIRDFIPREQMPSYLSCLDAFLVHLRPDPIFRTVIPSKIFEAMAMEVPIIHAVEGESACLVEDAGAGVCIPSGNAEKLAAEVIGLSAQKDRLTQMGRRGREVAKEKYSREVKARDALKCMELLLEKRSQQKHADAECEK